jgi:hypothetical protein
MSLALSLVIPMLTSPENCKSQLFLSCFPFSKIERTWSIMTVCCLFFSMILKNLTTTDSLGTGQRPQGLTPVRQLLYPLSHMPGPGIQFNNLLPSTKMAHHLFYYWLYWGINCIQQNGPILRLFWLNSFWQLHTFSWPANWPFVSLCFHIHGSNLSQIKNIWKIASVLNMYSHFCCIP